jgi:pimeloyl-ACP methyl ester carboxylesterase
MSSGAEARLTNDAAPRAVVLVNGGQSAELPGTWSATLEWLVRRLAPRFPGLAFLEVRYRIKSWKRLELCVEDALAAVDLAGERGADVTALVGFSMGGAVAVRACDHPSVRAVIGLAPWLPERLDVAPLAGRRFAVVHGALDRWLPGIPGVSPTSSHRGYERARSAGVLDAEYTLVPGGLHGTAIHAPWGLTRLPRAGRWADLLAVELERFQRL